MHQQPLEPSIETLDDGCVKVSLGGTSGTVSSHHLIEPKVNQLRSLLQKQGNSIYEPTTEL
jgi:hypothetical protein